MPPPEIEMIQGVSVVRDDRLTGGTKTRYIGRLFDTAEEIVYATPAEGGAQVALAATARREGKRATLFVARRGTPHKRTLQAREYGAKIYQVPHGYMSVVTSKARKYCADTGAYHAPFGMAVPGAEDAIAEAAKATNANPVEVWCAAGSGTLARGLARAWPNASLNVVQVGRDLTRDEVAGAKVWKYSRPFGKLSRTVPPFPSDRHYDAKAWEMMVARSASDNVLFWNVLGW
tara:strand:+ start:1254 stop:1949 length:696 start_codon:yes stop_codon:yes gene_type:complete